MISKQSTELSEGQRLTRISLLIFTAGLFASFFSDLSVYATEPWAQILAMLGGFINPSLFLSESSLDYSLFQEPVFQLLVFQDIGYTLAFALLGVFCAVILGVPLSLLYQFKLVSFVCAALRAVHELFWALIFIQLFGLSAITAILAITIPFACTFARVFNDIYCQAEIKRGDIFPDGKNSVSHFIYILLPQVWPSMRDYIRYRFECAIRTSAVLGFVGLPTIGFHLETAFKQAQYSYAAGLLLIFFGLIGSIRYWLKSYLIPFYILLAWYLLPETDYANSGPHIVRFFTQDIWPSAIHAADINWLQAISGYFRWATELFQSQAIVGIVNTLLLTLIAVALTGVSSVLLMPILAKAQSSRYTNGFNQLVLLLMRSTPEYILAFVLLLLLGPSMLPAVIALAIHNSALLGFLMARRIEQTSKEIGLPKHSLSQYLYSIQPRVYSGFLALLMYRAEIILRESAILGLLGITTLGFYIDSAFEDMRIDRAFFLLLITALLNVLLDQLARRIQVSITHQAVLVRSRQ